MSKKIRLEDIKERELNWLRNELIPGALNQLTHPADPVISFAAINNVLDFSEDEKKRSFLRTSLKDSLKNSLHHSLSHSLDHSLSHSLDHSLSNSLFRPLSHSLYHSLYHSLFRPLSHSPDHSLSNSLYHSLYNSLYSSLSNSLSHSLSNSLSNSLDHSLSNSLSNSLSHSLDHSLSLFRPLYHSLYHSLHSSQSNSLQSGQIKLAYNGVFWNFWIIRYLFGKHIGVQLPENELETLAAFASLSPLVGYIEIEHEGEKKQLPIPLPKPTKIRWRTDGVTEAPWSLPVYELHGDGEPSVEHPFFKCYHFKNVKIPERMGAVKSKDWDAAWIIDEENAEARRLLIQECGYEKLTAQLGAKSLDSFREYDLLQLNIQSLIDYKMLKMTCPSTGHIHILRVPPDMTSARAAAAWVNHGIDPETFILEH